MQVVARHLIRRERPKEGVVQGMRRGKGSSGQRINYAWDNGIVPLGPVSTLLILYTSSAQGMYFKIIKPLYPEDRRSLKEILHSPKRERGRHLLFLWRINFTWVTFTWKLHLTSVWIFYIIHTVILYSCRVRQTYMYVGTFIFYNLVFTRLVAAWICFVGFQVYLFAKDGWNLLSVLYLIKI